MSDPVIARYSFLPDRAPDFIDSPHQTVLEVQQDDISEVIAYCEDFNDSLIEVSCIVNGKVVNLSDVPAE